jgi:hypothetical protein
VLLQLHGLVVWRGGSSRDLQQGRVQGQGQLRLGRSRLQLKKLSWISLTL